MIRRAAGHFIPFGIPGFQNVRILGVQHPVAGGGNRIIHHFVDHTGGLGFVGGQHLALKQQRRRAQQAQLADQTCGATGPGEDTDHDLGQANLGLGIVGGKDAVRSQRQLQPDARSRAGQGGGDGLAALVGLGVHARAFDLAQQTMHLHRALEQALGRIVARTFLHLGQQVQVHPAGKGVFARGDHDALDRIIGQRVVNQIVQLVKTFDRHDVHRLVGHVPRDNRNAVGVLFHGEICHF